MKEKAILVFKSGALADDDVALLEVRGKERLSRLYEMELLLERRPAPRSSSRTARAKYAFSVKTAKPASTRRPLVQDSNRELTAPRGGQEWMLAVGRRP
jgi:hypothetical protein